MPDFRTADLTGSTALPPADRSERRLSLTVSEG